MICVQNAALNRNKRILIASDFSDNKASAQETSEWLRANGYRPVPNARPLLVYENGVCVRQWMQAEPQTGGLSSQASDVPAPPRPVFGWLSSLLHSHPSPTHQ